MANTALQGTRRKRRAPELGRWAAGHAPREIWPSAQTHRGLPILPIAASLHPQCFAAFRAAGPVPRGCTETTLVNCCHRASSRRSFGQSHRGPILPITAVRKPPIDLRPAITSAERRACAAGGPRVAVPVRGQRHQSDDPFRSPSRALRPNNSFKPTPAARLNSGVRGKTKHVFNSSLVHPRPVRRARVVFLVVVQVASLAHGFQVLRLAVLWRVVKMRYGQHNAASCFGVRLAVLGAAFREIRRAFAPVACPLADRCADRLPILRVSFPVFWSYRHVVL